MKTHLRHWKCLNSYIFSNTYFWIQRSISWGGALLSVKIGTASKKNQHRCSIRFEEKILSLILMIFLLMPPIFFSTWYEWKWILPKFGTVRPYFCFCETCWKRHKSFRFFFPWEWSQDTRQTVSHDDKAGIGWGWVSSWFSQHKQQSKLVSFSNDMIWYVIILRGKYNYKIQIHVRKWNEFSVVNVFERSNSKLQLRLMFAQLVGVAQHHSFSIEQKMCLSKF